ncbi:MAG: YihA family ribosome biogenesis GTP-binding protein [Rhodobacteraceae bacterium]|nr:YihA family ribosome biogenesis GTP-binding protein [Paracoccaceae bacterium]
MNSKGETILGPFEFMMGTSAPGEFPPAGLPEVGFAGRSNVGKSSLINAIARRRKLARTSNTPGRTREINFFSVGKGHIVADLPGYGYAKMSKQEIRRCSALIDDYLRRRATLRRLFLLIDARRGVMPVDDNFMQRLDEAAVAFQIVLTKTDKLSGSYAAMEKAVARSIESHPAALPALISTSSVTLNGIEEVRRAIAAID